MLHQPLERPVMYCYKRESLYPWSGKPVLQGMTPKNRWHSRVWRSRLTPSSLTPSQQCNMQALGTVKNMALVVHEWAKWRLIAIKILSISKLTQICKINFRFSHTNVLYANELRAKQDGHSIQTELNKSLATLTGCNCALSAHRGRLAGFLGLFLVDPYVISVRLNDIPVWRNTRRT